MVIVVTFCKLEFRSTLIFADEQLIMRDLISWQSLVCFIYIRLSGVDTKLVSYVCLLWALITTHIQLTRLTIATPILLPGPWACFVSSPEWPPSPSSPTRTQPTTSVPNNSSKSDLLRGRSLLPSRRSPSRLALLSSSSSILEVEV